MPQTLAERVQAVLSAAIECDQRRCPIAKCHCALQAEALVERFFLKPRPQRHRLIDEPLRDHLRALAADPAMPQRLIAERLGLRRGAVRRLIREMQLRPPRPWWPGHKLEHREERTR